MAESFKRHWTRESRSDGVVCYKRGRGSGYAWLSSKVSICLRWTSRTNTHHVPFTRSKWAYRLSFWYGRVPKPVAPVVCSDRAQSHLLCSSIYVSLSVCLSIRVCVNISSSVCMYSWCLSAELLVLQTYWLILECIFGLPVTLSVCFSAVRLPLCLSVCLLIYFNAILPRKKPIHAVT